MEKFEIGDRVRLVTLAEHEDEYGSLIGSTGVVTANNSTAVYGCPIGVILDNLADPIYFKESEIRLQEPEPIRVGDITFDHREEAVDFAINILEMSGYEVDHTENGLMAWDLENL